MRDRASSIASSVIHVLRRESVCTLTTVTTEVERFNQLSIFSTPQCQKNNSFLMTDTALHESPSVWPPLNSPSHDRTAPLGYSNGRLTVVCASGRRGMPADSAKQSMIHWNHGHGVVRAYQI